MSAASIISIFSLVIICAIIEKYAFKTLLFFMNPDFNAAYNNVNLLSVIFSPKRSIIYIYFDKFCKIR